MSWQLVALAAATSTGAGGLFSEEPIPDAAPSPLFAEEAPSEVADVPAGFTPRISSRIRLRAQAAVDTSFDERGENVFELSVGAELELDADLLESLRVYTSPDFVHVTAISREGGDRQLLYLDVPEAHLTWTFGSHHLRAGTQVFSWGASDLVAPSDVLNPLDLRRGAIASEPDDLKIPVLAAELLLALGPLTVRGVWIPIFTASRFFLVGWDDAVGKVAIGQGLSVPELEELIEPPALDRLGDQLLVNERPSDRLDHGSWAARATVELGEADLSATFVYGWEPLPQITLDPNLGVLAAELVESLARGEPIDLVDPEVLEAIGELQDALEEGRTIFRGRYGRRTLVGADVIWVVDPLILKADVAYTFSRTLYLQGDFRPRTHPWLNAVIGAEYVYGEDLQIIVELFAITIFDVRSDTRLVLVEPSARPPSEFDLAGRTIALPGGIAVVRYTALDGDLRFEAGLVSTFTRGDLIFAPVIRWRMDDRQELSLGGLLVEGRSDGYGGIYTNNDRIFVGYEWSLAP